MAKKGVWMLAAAVGCLVIAGQRLAAFPLDGSQTVLPASTELSDLISKDLKKRGFRFVGSTIIYSFLQAVGVVNDHSRDCFLAPKARVRK